MAVRAFLHQNRHRFSEIKIMLRLNIQNNFAEDKWVEYELRTQE